MYFVVSVAIVSLSFNSLVFPRLTVILSSQMDSFIFTFQPFLIPLHLLFIIPAPDIIVSAGAYITVLHRLCHPDLISSFNGIPSKFHYYFFCSILLCLSVHIWASQVGQETWVQSLGWEDPLE